MQQAFDLRFRLRTSLSPLANFGAVSSCFTKRKSIATTLNDPARLARVFTFKALYFWSIGQQDRAIDASEQALVDSADGRRDAVASSGNSLRGRGRDMRGASTGRRSSF